MAGYLAGLRRGTRRTIKDVLMDQRVVAGLGNIYVNELLFTAGVRRVNISLDTLDEANFARISRWGRLPQVLDGIAARQSG